MSFFLHLFQLSDLHSTTNLVQEVILEYLHTRKDSDST